LQDRFSQDSDAVRQTQQEQAAAADEDGKKEDGVRKTLPLSSDFKSQNDRFTKTGSGQTYETSRGKRVLL
jgi:hypothetical protein